MKKIQLKAILILISVSLILGIIACSKNEPEQVDPTVESESDTDTIQSDLGQETIEQESNMNNYEDLNGKKFLIIGNSYVYNSLSVVKKSNSVVDQESRSNDQGYFYQLCKANGYEVSVTNWTFGGHGLYELFGTTCT